ncbi:MAG: hypothetical protein VB030_04950 [Eubacterium aggregans]|uniref:hypothetical protein n=1 Tax=Clostridia TaxID=186801 RepID=UPI002B209EE4|nr:MULTISPECIES: hypothetical protein [Clostridia]MEA5002145.1 hypothetical protein [Christensenella sp.]MEA5073500.1 hypothetical protein [Eubacterium aggregans]
MIKKISVIVFVFLCIFTSSVFAASAEECDSGLLNLGVPQQTLDQMSEQIKQATYESLMTTEDADHLVFDSYDEEVIAIPSSNTNTRSIGDDYLKFGVSTFHVSNNFLRTYIRPYYEWTNPQLNPDTAHDSFSFLIDFNRWNILTTPSFTTISALGQERYYTNPSKLDFNGATYPIHSAETFGMGSICARRDSNLGSPDVIVTYVHNPVNWAYTLSFGPFSIDFASPFNGVDVINKVLKNHD